MVAQRIHEKSNVVPVVKRWRKWLDSKGKRTKHFTTVLWKPIASMASKIMTTCVNVIEWVLPSHGQLPVDYSYLCNYKGSWHEMSQTVMSASIFWHYYSSGLWTWTNHLSSLSLSFLTWKMGMIIPMAQECSATHMGLRTQKISWRLKSYTQ